MLICPPPGRRRKSLALVVLVAGVVFHAWVGTRFEHGLDLQALRPCLLLALPYAILAMAALLSRTTLNYGLVGFIALGLLFNDLVHISEWRTTGKEAVFTSGLLWLGEVWAAFWLSVLTLVFGSSPDTSDQVAQLETRE
jgi:hypothetical protein